MWHNALQISLCATCTLKAFQGWGLPFAALAFHMSLLWRISWFHVSLKLMTSTVGRGQLQSGADRLPSLPPPPPRLCTLWKVMAHTIMQWRYLKRLLHIRQLILFIFIYICFVIWTVQYNCSINPIFYWILRNMRIQLVSVSSLCTLQVRMKYSTPMSLPICNTANAWRL